MLCFSSLALSPVFETSHFLLAGVGGAREYGGKTCKTDFTCSQCSKFLLNTFIHTLFLGTTAGGSKQSLQMLSEPQSVPLQGTHCSLSRIFLSKETGFY